MRQSQLFTKTRREAPADEVSKNAILLTRAGFINKELAGVYSYLPLGWRVIENLKKVIGEEMEKLGSHEILMSTLQNKETWEKTNRWSDEQVDVWFKSKLKNDTEVGFGWSHEEPIVEMLTYHVSSYHDLPVAMHQFQNKLRNEVRAKSGIMRCREFIMKDMYYFAGSDAENLAFYESAIQAYLKVFERVGLGNITYVTSASGGVFTDKFSHEFQTVSDAGEDLIYVNEERKIALNEEIYNDKTLKELGLSKSDFEERKAAEVGNIFNFGTKKSEDLGLFIKDKSGEKRPAHLSSYGIGITRLMGTIVEVLADGKGMIWPEEVAPFKFHLIALTPDARKAAEKIYEKLASKGIEALYDDRDLRAGEKLNDADLIGIPAQILVGDKAKEDVVELKNRKTGEISLKNIDEITG